MDEEPLSATERVGLLLAHSRYQAHGVGKLEVGYEVDAGTAERLVERGLFERSAARLTLLPAGAAKAEAYCPECGREVPVHEGRRPPHAMRDKVGGHTGRQFLNKTQQSQYWCPGGTADDRPPDRNAKPSTFPRWYS